MQGRGYMADTSKLPAKPSQFFPSHQTCVWSSFILMEDDELSVDQYWSLFFFRILSLISSVVNRKVQNQLFDHAGAAFQSHQTHNTTFLGVNPRFVIICRASPRLHRYLFPTFSHTCDQLFVSCYQSLQKCFDFISIQQRITAVRLY